MRSVTSGEAVERFVCRSVGKRHISGAGHAIGFLNSAGEPVGGVYFSNYDGQNVYLDAAAVPKSRWLDRRGLWAIFHYVFDVLGCARATALVPESNHKSIKILLQAGFVREASLARAAPGDERMLVFRMFADDCPWLRR